MITWASELNPVVVNEKCFLVGWEGNKMCRIVKDQPLLSIIIHMHALTRDGVVS